MSNPEKINILLIDDHAIVMDGIASILATAATYNIAGKATNGTTALEIISNEQVDIAITDYSMEDIDGLTLIHKIKKIKPEIKILVLSMHDEQPIVQELLRAGIDGYILKKYTHHELLTALDIISNDGQFWSPEINKLLLTRMQPDSNNQITDREMEVLKLLTQELTSREIAEKLFISERTVDTHRKNLLRKTNSASTVGLIKYAYEHKLL